MANANYQRGRRFEYETCKRYEALGNDVIRASGSHGLFDVVAVQPNSGVVTFISCKVTQDESAAKLLVKRFIESPPYKPFNLPPKVHQTIVVKVLNKYTLEGTV